MQTEHFTTSLEHILAELKRIDLLIQLQLIQTRQLNPYGCGFDVPYIQRQKVDELCVQPFGIPFGITEPGALLKNEIRTALDHMAGEIWLRKAESKRRNIRLRLDELGVLFELNPLELDIFLICLAPELDLLYERIYAYLQGDATKTRPGVRLVSNLLSPSLSAKLNAKKFFAVESSLCKNFLLHNLDDSFHPQALSLSENLKVDERIVNHLLDLEIIDANLLPHVRQASNKHGFQYLSLPADLRHQLALVAQKREDLRQENIIYFMGTYGMGKRFTAEALCNELGLSLLIIDLKSILSDDHLGFENAVRLVIREAKLQQAALYWQGFDLLLSEDKQSYLNALVLELQKHRGLTFLSGERIWEPVDAMHNFSLVRFEFPFKDHTERFKLLSEFSGGGSYQTPNPDLRGPAYAPQFIRDRIRNTADTTTHI
jgi:hypothetical protein